MPPLWGSTLTPASISPGAARRLDHFRGVVSPNALPAFTQYGGGMGPKAPPYCPPLATPIREQKTDKDKQTDRQTYVDVYLHLLYFSQIGTTKQVQAPASRR